MPSDPVDNMKARVRCPECRNTFRARIHRLVFAEPVACPVCRTELKFRVSRHTENEDVQHYIRYVEERTHHPHFYVNH
jgi:hydrogenase maturation factor HypF (carbamoyltransferase family)